jgi:hypothetical protein
LIGILISNQPLRSQTVTSKEDFDDFFWKFMDDSTFQIERIKFPIMRTFLRDDPEKLFIEDSTLVTESEWKHIYFLLGMETNYRPQIYDNFSAELRDTDERTFAWLGIETGIQVYYYFQRINGKWYLIRIEDKST